MDAGSGLTTNVFWVLVAALNFALFVLIVVLLVLLVRWLVSRRHDDREIDDLRARVARLEAERETSPPRS